MSKWAKFWDWLSSGQSDNNIDYSGLAAYLERLGWNTESAKTSHQFYKHPLVPEVIKWNKSARRLTNTQEKTKMDGYEVKVYYSPNDECYVAQIVEFTGCAVDGPTPEIALARLHEAKEDWICIVREKGGHLPAPRYGQKQDQSLVTA